MFVGLAISDWMIWVAMILFILVYFVVTERINRREEAAEERGEG
jgi:phosphotransferase system  glucose/maltose/N-acetylglucosamine-specific IIC component